MPQYLVARSHLRETERDMAIWRALADACDGPSADGAFPKLVTSEGCSYSGTWSWVKLMSIPESPPLGLYDTVPVQLCRLITVD